MLNFFSLLIRRAFFFFLIKIIFDLIWCICFYFYESPLHFFIIWHDKLRGGMGDLKICASWTPLTLSLKSTSIPFLYLLLKFTAYYPMWISLLSLSFTANLSFLPWFFLHDHTRVLESLKSVFFQSNDFYILYIIIQIFFCTTFRINFTIIPLHSSQLTLNKILYNYLESSVLAPQKTK